MPFLGPVQVAYPSLVELDISTYDITLVWPTSYFDVPSVINGIHYNVIAANIIVTDGLANTNTITLPDATQSSPGSSFIITNIGASSFQLLRADGSELILIPNTPTTSNSFFVVLTDTSTLAGGWQFVQFGAGTSQAQASALAGNGLEALLGKLTTNTPVNIINSTPYNVSITNDKSALLIWNTGVGTMNLPLIAFAPEGFYISVNNEGGGILTINGNGSNIDNSPTISVAPKQSLSIISDGTNWWTLGFGQNLSSSNFASGSAVAPSITFTADTTTGIYYYNNAFPPVNPPGIGFSVGSSQIANLNASGLYMNAGHNITMQDPTNVSQTVLSTNAAYAQMSWFGPGLVNPGTLQLTSTASRATLTLNDATGPFNSFSISTSTLTGTVTYNAIDIMTVDVTGVITFDTNIILTTPLSIASGGTGQNTRQTALNALMPPTPVIGDLLYYDGTNWIRLPVGAHAAGAVLTLVGAPPIPTWVP